MSINIQRYIVQLISDMEVDLRLNSTDDTKELLTNNDFPMILATEPIDLTQIKNKSFNVNQCYFPFDVAIKDEDKESILNLVSEIIEYVESYDHSEKGIIYNDIVCMGTTNIEGIRVGHLVLTFMG